MVNRGAHENVVLPVRAQAAGQLGAKVTKLPGQTGAAVDAGLGFLDNRPHGAPWT
jgi:hypothetical protein